MSSAPRVHPVAYISPDCSPTSIRFHQPDNTSGHLLIGDSGGNVTFWDLQSWRSAGSIAAFPSSVPVAWLAVCDEGRLLAVRGKGALLRLFDLTTRDLIMELSEQQLPTHLGFCIAVQASNGQGDKVSCLHALPTGQSGIAVASIEDRRIEIVARIKEESSDCGMIVALKFVLPSSMLLAGYENGQLVLWDWANQRILSKLNVSPLVPLALDFDDNVDLGVVGGNEDYLLTFSIDRDNMVLATPGSRQSMPTKGVSRLKIRLPGSRIVVAGGWDSTIKLFSWKRLKPLGALKFHSEAVEDVDCSEKPVASKGGVRLLAAASKDGKVSFWNVYQDI